MQKKIARAARLVLAVVFVAPLAAAQAPERSPTQGLKETHVSSRPGVPRPVSRDAKLQIQRLSTPTTRSSPSLTDMKGDYKKVMKSVDSMNKRVGVARQKIGEMQKAGEVYFSGRAETIEGIKDPRRLEQAKRRLGSTQKEIDGVLTALRETGDAFEPFRKDLADQITFLGSDLTPSAMTALKPNADKLNARGAELFSRADKAHTGANTYFQGLKACQT